MITLLRVLFGFIVACLVAGVVTVAFVVTPADIAALPAEAQTERLGNAGVLSLLVATHSAIFALPFALIAIVIAELSRVRSWIYYVLVGIAIALGGFAAEYLERGARAAVDLQQLRAGRLYRRRRAERPRLLARRRAARGWQARRCSAASGRRPSGRARAGGAGDVILVGINNALTRNCVVAAQQSV